MLLLFILRNNKNAWYMYWNERYWVFFFFEIRKPKTLFFPWRSTPLYMFMYPDTCPRLWPIHFAFLWLCGDSNTHGCPRLITFLTFSCLLHPNIQSVIVFLVVVTAFCWQAKTTKWIPLLVLNIEQWNHIKWQMAIHLMFLKEVNHHHH